MKKIGYLIALGLAFIQCSRQSASTTAFRANPLADSIRIYMLQPDETIPDKSEFVREIKMGVSMFSNSCGYKNLMNYAHFTARQFGANMIHITEIKKPFMTNGCYHITARFYKNQDAFQIQKLADEKNAANKSRLPADADYALIHFYRPKDLEGSIVSYDIKMDNQSAIGRSTNGHQFDYKVTTFGKHRFFGKTRKSDSVTLEVQKGQEYFIRCGVAKGESISNPDMYVMENYVGMREIAELR